MKWNMAKENMKEMINEKKEYLSKINNEIIIMKIMKEERESNKISKKENEKISMK